MGNGGSLWKKIHCKLHRNAEVRVLMLGLNDAGKTTILCKLKHGNSITTNPTVGFNVESITYKGMKFTTWDVSGQSGARSLWHYYYPNMDVLILVVDSNDRERMKECRDELSKLMGEDELTDCCLLIMANKQDLPNAMTRQEIMEKLDLNKLPPARPWYIQDTCAISGEGLYEGLSWVKNQVITRSVRRGISQHTADVEDGNKLHTSCFSFTNYFTRSNHAVNESDRLELL